MHFKKTQKKHDHIKIKWAKNNICRIDFNEFTLSVPMENLKDIRKWEDIEAFSKNRAVSAYNYEKNYTAGSRLNGCSPIRMRCKACR